MSWVAIGVGVLGAGTSIYNNQQQRRSAQAGTQQTNEPWVHAQPMLLQLLNSSQDLFNEYRPEYSPYRPYGGEPGQYGEFSAPQGATQPARRGGGGGGQPSTYGQLEQFAGQAIPGFFNPQQVGQQNPFMQGLMQPGGTEVLNPYIGQENPILNELAQRGLSGEIGSDPELSRFIQGMFGASGLDGQQAPAPRMGGEVRRGFSGSGMQAQAPTPTNGVPYGGLMSPYLKDLLEGKWLNSNPNQQGVLDALSSEAMEDYKNSIVPQIDSSYQRAGRYGSGSYAMAQAKANEEFNEGLMNQKARTLSDLYQSERGNMMGGLGILGQLQQAELAAQVAREGNQAAASAAGAGSAAAMRAAEMENEYRNRALLLNAIGQGSGNRQFGYGLTGDMASLLSGDQRANAALFSNDQQFGRGLMGDLALGMQGGQLGALGIIPQLGGVQAQFGANQVARAGLNQSNRLAQQARQDAIRQQQLAYDTNQWNFGQQQPYQRLDDYLGIVGPVAGMGGSGRTTSPYTGPSGLEAGLMGGLGGYFAGGGNFGRSPQPAPMNQYGNTYGMNPNWFR